jgi:hypothetical protein
LHLREKGPILIQRFNAPKFTISLAFLADVFGISNSLNIYLQGTELTIWRPKKGSKPFNKSLFSGEED